VKPTWRVSSLSNAAKTTPELPTNLRAPMRPPSEKVDDSRDENVSEPSGLMASGSSNR
jgi:hypothetical protein